MSNNSMITIAVVLFLVMFAPRFVKIVPPGHVSVSNLFGNIDPEPVSAGAHLVNPLLRWQDFDVRENTHKESAQVPTRDQLQTKVDVSVQWRINPAMAAEVFGKVGTREQAVAVYLVPHGYLRQPPGNRNPGIQLICIRHAAPGTRQRVKQGDYCHVVF